MTSSSNGGRILDPDAADLLADWLARSAVPVHEQPLEKSRNSGLVGPDVTGPAPAVLSVEDDVVAAPNGVEVPVRIYRPEDADGLPVLVYSHGGGWTLLSIDSADVLCRHLANRARAVVVSVGYRLAPENPFPAAFDDVQAVTEWVAGGGLGYVPDTLALGGDSAGGNLSAGLSTYFRDNGGPQIDFQLLLYPSLGTDLDTPSMRELGPDPRFRLQPASMRWFWRNYFGGTETHDDYRAVPAKADTFAGLPATLVVTCGFDPIRDDGARYAEALRADGVDVDAYEASSLPHGFAMMLGRVPAAQEAFGEVIERTRIALHGA